MVNKGEVGLSAVTGENHDIELKVQMVDVTKPLLAVRKMCGAGNRVVFDDEGSYIEDKATGARTAIQREDGTYAVWVWVAVPEEPAGGMRNNSFCALAPEEPEEFVDVCVPTGFTRPAVQ